MRSSARSRPTLRALASRSKVGCAITTTARRRPCSRSSTRRTPGSRSKKARKILREALERFAIAAARCEHRVGKLAIGDCAVWVGVSAAHRGAAFDACRYIIDETKSRVPIWKKEHYRDGQSGWVNCATKVGG